MSVIPHPTWIEINLSAIEENARALQKMSGTPLMAVVKANAYGYGSIEVARAALAGGASWLAVSRLCEAVELRHAGISAPILILGGVVPEEVDTAIQYDLTLPLFDYESVAVYSQRAREFGKPIHVHLKVETGLGRYGVFPEQVLSLAQNALAAGGIDLDGVFSHYAMADVKDDPLTPLQVKRFDQGLELLAGVGIHPKWIHLANTAGILYGPRCYYNLTRAGGALLGVGSEREDLPLPHEIRRAFAWKARLMSVKKYPEGWGIGYGQVYRTSPGEIIGVLPVGHGDGYRRVPGNRVLIQGKAVSVVGRVGIDQMMVHLPDCVPLSTEAVLIGSQGNETITPEDLSSLWKVPLTNVTVINHRVPRVYYRDGEEPGS